MHELAEACRRAEKLWNAYTTASIHRECCVCVSSATAMCVCYVYVSARLSLRVSGRSVFCIGEAAVRGAADALHAMLLQHAFRAGEWLGVSIRRRQTVRRLLGNMRGARQHGTSDGNMHFWRGTAPWPHAQGRRSLLPLGSQTGFQREMCASILRRAPCFCLLCVRRSCLPFACVRCKTALVSADAAALAVHRTQGDASMKCVAACSDEQALGLRARGVSCAA